MILCSVSLTEGGNKKRVGTDIQEFTLIVFLITTYNKDLVTFKVKKQKILIMNTF